MNDIELLQKLFEDRLIKSKESVYGKPYIELKESDLYSITIQNVPEDAVAIKTDSFPNLQGFFNCCSNIGQCKRADFVIITDDKLIFIELCKGKKQEKKVVQQLKGAQCVIEYCRNISDKFYNYNSLLKNNIHCFVSVSNIGVNKRGSKQKQYQNNTPDNFLKINASNNLLQFNALCCTK